MVWAVVALLMGAALSWWYVHSSAHEQQKDMVAPEEHPTYGVVDELVQAASSDGVVVHEDDAPIGGVGQEEVVRAQQVALYEEAPQPPG